MNTIKIVIVMLIGALIAQQGFSTSATLQPTSPEALQGILGNAFKASSQSRQVKKTRKQLHMLTQSVPVGEDNMGELPPPLTDKKSVTAAKTPATVVMHGQTTGDGAWLLPHLQKRQQGVASLRTANKPYQSVPLKTIYSITGRNRISDTDGNAILSPVPIVHIAAQPGSIILDKWIDNDKGEHIGVVFNLKNPHLHVVQMMVMTKGSHPAVSLVFTVAHVHGRVFRLPQHLMGVAPLSTSPVFGEPSAYDQEVIHMMQQVLAHQPLGNAWQYTVRYHPPSPYQQFSVKRHQRWVNATYRIDAFELCSRYNGTLYLRANTFAGPRSIAVTVTQNRLTLGECTRLVVLGAAKQVASAIDSTGGLLGPAKESAHV